MDTITIIDGIGWNRNYIAAFKNDERIIFNKINPEERENEILKLKHKFDGCTCYQVTCSSQYKEFVSVTDFPTNLQSYFK